MIHGLCICGSALWRIDRILDGGLRLVRCDDCDLLRMLDWPDNPMAIYLNGYHHRPPCGDRAAGASYFERFEHDFAVANLRWRAIERRGYRPATVLDVGCANGAFLASARARGIAGAGIEPNEVMAAFAVAKSGATVSLSWGGVSGYYDLVAFNDVIEHLSEPAKALASAYQVLECRGGLVVDTPDADTLDGAGAHHIRPVEHLWYFDERTLRRLIETAGFEVTAVERPIPGKLVAYAERAAA